MSKKMTMTQKIIAAHCGRDSVQADEIVLAQIELVLGNDITAPVAINEFDKACISAVFDKDKIALVLDHFTPNKDIKAAEQSKKVREFARRHDITHFYDVGQAGIEHALLPEKGLVSAGDLIIGADSHTCTYGGLGLLPPASARPIWRPPWLPAKVWLRVPAPSASN